MLTLNNLQRTVAPRKRVGRGGSRGGTSGRGHKGQRGRTSGNVRAMFEGGQMPLFRRLPKRGFSNERFAQVFETVNIGHLDRLFNAGDQVTHATLLEKGLIRGTRGALLKILGGGDLRKQLYVEAHAISASAKSAIELLKGEVRIIAREG